MKIRFSLLWLCGFIICLSTQFLHCISKYVTIAIVTTPQSYVSKVSLSTLNSIGLTDIEIDKKTRDAAIKAGLIVQQTAPQNSTCFSISDQGIKFEYSRKPIATENDNDNIQLPQIYQDAIKKISDANLRKEIEDAYLAFEKNLALIGTSLGESTHAVIAGDIYKKDSPYTAPVRAMYKEVRKLAKAVGLTLPDPEEASWYWKYLTKRNLILGSVALIGISGLIGYKFFNMTPMQIVGTDVQACGTVVQGAGFMTRKVSEGTGTIGRVIESVGTGIKKFGGRLTKPKTPPAPAPTRGPLVKATPQITPTPELFTPGNIPDSQPLQLTPTPEIFENMPVPSNTPTPGS
jgi:hypothetical protein